jgi:hypothetical protein
MPFPSCLTRIGIDGRDLLIAALRTGQVMTAEVIANVLISIDLVQDPNATWDQYRASYLRENVPSQNSHWKGLIPRSKCRHLVQLSLHCSAIEETVWALVHTTDLMSLKMGWATELLLADRAANNLCAVLLLFG